MGCAVWVCFRLVDLLKGRSKPFLLVISIVMTGGIVWFAVICLRFDKKGDFTSKSRLGDSQYANGSVLV